MDRDELRHVLRWWEKKRVWYNLAVGIVGLFGLVMFSSHFYLEDLIGILIYGIIANVFYSLGILVELFDFYYFNGKLRIHRARYLLFIFGTLISCLITFIQIVCYYLWLAF